MSGYIKYFDDGGKNISFVTDDEEVYKKYNEIWEVVRKLLKVKSTVNPIRDDKYIIVKLKIFNGTNRTTFTNNIIPIERNNYVCIAAKKKINTGIYISLPENSYGSIRDKSSLAAKGLLTLGGVIDNDYTGEIIVIMTSLIEPIKIKKGQKIAQLIVSNISYPEIKTVKFLKETERNNKGFGKMDIINSIKKDADEIFEYFQHI